MDAVIDSDVLIDYLQGLPQAQQEINRYETAFYSIISWIEVMTGARTAQEEAAVEQFLSRLQRVQLTPEITAQAVANRRTHRLKTPDAIVYATAQVEGCLIVTRNTRDLKPDWPDVRVPYGI